MEKYTIGDWILAGWTLDDLVTQASGQGWTARQVIDWCIDHADDAAQEADVRALPGYDELEAMVADELKARNV